MERPWIKAYEPGVPPEVRTTQHDSIPALLAEAFRRFAPLPAFHNMGTSLSYAQIQRLSASFAGFLQTEAGLRKGDRVALMLPNILQYPVALFGILQAGMVAVNVNPLYTARELRHQLADSGARAIVLFENAAHLLQAVLADTDIRRVIVTKKGDLLKFPRSLLVNFIVARVKKLVPAWNLSGALGFKEALGRGAAAGLAPVALCRDDLAFLQYTGGTTGTAKGAMLTHGNIVANVCQAGEWVKNSLVDGREIVITGLPLYHIFSLTANCLSFTAHGGLNVLITNPRDISGFVKELAKWRFTAITGVNTLFNALLRHPGFAALDFSALKMALSAGTALQKPVAEAWHRVTGVPLIEAYGLTETSPAVCMNPMNLAAYNGFAGLPICSTRVKIKDDAERDLAAGEVGEICIQGPQVMAGYWGRPEETARAMSADGFLKTGDLGFLTPEGYLKIVDRKKDMILVSGFNVYPNEVEEVAAAHPGVLECAAVGVADEKSGEAVKLFVVRRDPGLSAQQLRAFCAEQLAGYKVPRYYEFREQLPKSNVGKILRKALRRQPS